MARAKEVEGEIDGVDFVLKNDQIAAIQEFVDSRQLLSFADSITRWSGKTALEAAEALDRSLRTKYNDTLSSGVSHLSIRRFTTDSFVFSFQRYGTRSEQEEVRLKDLHMIVAPFLVCMSTADCGEHTISENGSERRTSNFSFPDALVMGNLDQENKPILSYIYYRVMYSDDSIDFHPNE
jgi:hypothetical protein